MNDEPNIEPWPANPDGLAAEASEAIREAQGTKDEQDGAAYVEKAKTAFRELWPLIRAVVKRMCGRYSLRDDADELTNDAYLHLFSRIQKFNPSESFEAWATTVVKHRIIDLLRKKSRRRTKSLDPISSSEMGVGIAEQNVDASESSDSSQISMSSAFSKSDWKSIISWHSPDRIILLGMFGLCAKCNASEEQLKEWLQWLADVGIENPTEYHEALIRGRLEDRRHCLADELGLADDAFRQRWTRKRHLIVQLDFFWDECLANRTPFSKPQFKQVLAATLTDRTIVLCVQPSWFRVPSRKRFIEVFESWIGRMQWLRLFEGSHDERCSIVSQGMGTTREKVQDRWNDNSKLAESLAHV